MKLGLILSATDKMSRVVNGVVDKVNRKFKSLERGMQAVNSVSNKMFVAGGIAAAGIYKTIIAAEGAATAQARLDNAFKSMWGDSGTIRDISKAQGLFAEKLALQIGVEAKIIKLTQAKLATFQAVSSQTAIMSGVFERATRAAHDMEAGGYGTAADNAVMLGKALEDPLKMATALKRTGTLTAADVVNVQTIARTKGLAAAQEAVLQAIERQFKGSAAATVNATDVMKTGFLAVTEAIGGAFLPSVEDAKGKMVSTIEPVIAWINTNHKLIQTIAKVAIGLLAAAVAIRVVTTAISIVKAGMIAYNLVAIAASGIHTVLTGNLMLHSAAVKAAAAGQWLLNIAMSANPIGLIIIGIAALVAGIVIAWKKFAGFRAVIMTVWETVKGFGGILKDYVIDRIKGIISGLGSMGKAIGLLFKGKFSEAFDEAKSGVRALSGYDAKLKAVTRTKELATNVSGTYTTILAREKEAQKPKSTEAMQSSSVKTANRTSNVNTATTQVNYNPTINMTGGSAADKESFRKMLNDNKTALEQTLNEINNKNKRVSYQTIY